tara:strand:- start:16086 stop:17612 length:1527 start_codon:yes stop_codon:yes gene_type:complete
MTVSTSTSFNSYAGNGSTTSFAYAFKIFQDSNLVVTLVNDTTGVETTQTLTTDYTVTGAGSDSGGSVVFVTAPALGNTVVIRRVLPVTQETNYVPNDPFPAEAHEDALDKLTMLVQQEVASSELAVQFPEGDVGSGINNILPSVTGRSDKLLKFGLDGGVEVIAASDLSNAIIGANYSVDTFTGTGSTTVYTLSSAPGSKANTAIYIDGVYQAKANYSVSVSTLTFTTAPPLNSAIEIVIGDAIPAGAATTASAVSYTQGGTGAVTTNVQAKLRETVSVKDFGAVGDGVTDDTAAFTAANTASGVASVFVPAGTYVITGTVTGNFFTFGDVTISSGTVNSITQISPAITELSAGAGISPVTNSIFKTSTVANNNIVTTTILLDLTGLQSGGTAGDIIGKNGSGAAYLGQITTANNGTILGVSMTCLEAPVGGDADIDLYSATEATGVEDTAISALTETQIINSGTLSVGTIARGNTIDPNQYLYLVGQGTSNAAYSAGRLLIEITGYL